MNGPPAAALRGPRPAAGIGAALCGPVLASPHWYRVAALRPKLSSRARLHRHRYRGETWYLMHDAASGQVMRFTPAARSLIAAMDGQRSVDALWRQAVAELGEHAPTQDEVVSLLGQLHGADLLAGRLQPDVQEMLERGRQRRRRQRRQRYANPLAVRVPLWDPGRWLDRHAGLWRRLWGLPGALLWLALVLPALALLPESWASLTGNLADRVLQPQSLLLLGLAFLALKLVHELGHATALHARGGEVHDLGLMLLAGLPVAYVDASAASVLPARRDRILVGAAGMAVELAIAAAAFLLWRSMEPGLARALCFSTMLAAGLSTLVFNGNPLLRYDAYYMLADALQMPNLAQRSSRAWGLLAERWLLRLPDAEPMPASRREVALLLGYGLASAACRVLVTVLLALFVATRFFFVGVLLGLLALVQLVWPPLKAMAALWRDRGSLQPRKTRIVLGAGAVAAALAVLAVAVPLPQRTLAEGVVWLDPAAVLRAGTEGEVAELLVAPGTRVAAGTPLLRSQDPMLAAELKRQAGRVAELQAQFDAAWVADRAGAELLRPALAFEAAALDRLRQRHAALVVRAATAGVFQPLHGADLPGRAHRQGDVLGHVVDGEGPGEPARPVRLLLPQADAQAVLGQLRAAALRLPADPSQVLPATVLRSAVAAADRAPSRALATSGGGAAPADPQDPQGLKLLQRMFELELAPQGGWPGRAPPYGQRVAVRLELEPQPLAAQLRQALRRLFLRHFAQ